MADRTVTTRLVLGVAGWKAGKNEVKRDLKDLNTSFKETAGFATGFRKKLEEAAARLPKIEIDANSSPAEVKFARVRQEMEDLSHKTIGVDIDAATAFAELGRLQAELAEIEDGASFEVRAGVQQALADLRAVGDEVRRLDGRRIALDVDTGRLSKAVAAVGSGLESALGVIGSTTPGQVAIAVGAIAGLPIAAQVAAGSIVLALGGALATVGLTSAAQADRVKAEWSDLGSELRRELGDVAAPLEDSAIHASGVARQAFQALKPILREVFADLGPDVDHFVDGLGDAVDRIGPSLEPLGEAFGDLLRSLGDQADTWGDNLGDAVTTFAETTSRHADDIATLFTAVTTAIRMTADATSWLADRWEGFLTVNEELHSSLLGINKDYDGSQLAVGRMMESMRGAIETAYGLNGATNESATAVRSLSAALEDFYDPAAKALDAEIRLKAAIEDATQAAKDQSMSEVDRLRSVQDLTRAIADAAKTEAESTGKTVEAGQAYMDNIGRLREWAGGNQAARDTVAALGDSLGITTVKTRDGTFAVNALGEAVRILPSGKTTKIEANTKEGKRLLEELKRKIDDLKDKTVNVNVRTTYDSKEARAAAIARDAARGAASGTIIQYAAGGITGYAAGGLRPHIVNSPTTIVYGEGSSGRGAREAFIPLDEYRPQAIDLLGRVAEHFGFSLYGRDASQQVQQVAVTVDAASVHLSAGIGDATMALTTAFDASGTVTSALNQMNAASADMTAGWTTGAQQLGDSISNVATVTSDGVELVASSVDVLSGSVQDLLMALAAGKASSGSSGSSKSSAKGGKSKGGSGYLLEPMDTVRGGAKGKKGKGGISATLTPMNTPRKPPGGMIEGDYGLSGTPDWTPGAYSAITSGGAPVNSSQVSAPQTAMPRPAPTAGGAESGGGSASGGRSPSGGIHVPITMNGVTVRQEADIPKIGSAVGFTLLSRGNV